MKYTKIVVCSLLGLACCESYSLPPAEFLNTYPQKSLVVAENGTKSIYYSAHEAITVANKKSILSIDYRKNVNIIWKFTSMNESGDILKANCKHSYENLAGKAAEYLLDKANTIDKSKIRKEIISAVENDPIFFISCKTEKDISDSTLTVISYPTDKDCPIVYSKQLGTVSASHVALYSKNVLTVFSIPLPDKC